MAADREDHPGTSTTGARREEVAKLKSRGYKNTEIATMLGVHRTTIQEDLRQPNVQENIQTFRTAGLEALADIAREASDDALRALRDALGEEEPSVRISAAKAILAALAPVLNHGELNVRLAKLEAKAAADTQAPPTD